MTNQRQLQKWRAERFRSADVRRRIHQRTTEHTRKRCREPGSVSDSAVAKEKPLSFWDNVFFSFIIATLFFFAIFGMSFIVYGMGIGIALVAWLAAFVTTWLGVNDA